MRSRLLVVAKDTELRARLARRLSRMGHGVELAESISHARHVISGKKFCLAILSLDGVGPEGFHFAEELRSAVSETLLIGTGNNFGATKHEDLIDPSDDDTLMARVNHAVHLQHDPDLPRQPPIQFAGYTLDLDGAALINERGKEIVLTRGEFALLREFIRAAGRVLSRDHLRAALTGRDTEPYERSMDMLVVRLRRKIERDPKNPSLIITVPGQGYKFAVKPVVSVGPEETPVFSASSSARVGGLIGAHIGITGGQVVASRTGSARESEYNLTGDTVNLPSRITPAAEADEILTSDGTRRVLAERFDCADAGTLTIKGFTEPVGAWRLRGLRPTGREQRPFVGRRGEIRLLETALAEARETERGQAVYVRGEAGIGKTRLIEEVQRAATAAGFACHAALVLDFGGGAAIAAGGAGRCSLPQ